MKKVAAIAIGVVSTVAVVVSGKAGVDLSVATTPEDWSCLVKDHDIEYAVIRTYRSSGQLDTNGPNNIINAVGAGISDVGGYIFPCMQGSSYNVANNITCASAEDQVADTVRYLLENEVGMSRDVLDKNISPKKAYINRMWLDIEDEQPPKYFDADPAVNQAFLKDMVAELNRRHIPVGIYTTLTYWQNIMDNVLGYDEYPLWYPRYDGEDSMDFFSPFAGWEEALIKQTGGDVGYCGITQVDSDYML